MSYNQTVFPYDTVVYITDVMGGAEWQGSGVLITPDEVTDGEPCGLSGRRRPCHRDRG